MKVITDFHIHSRYARATSKDLSIKNLEKYARVKGVNLLGTGDFTHPEWFAEIKKELTEDGTGILKTKTGFPFLLSVEVSNIYPQDGKLRRIHNVILAKSIEVAQQINALLNKKGKLASDGRPIFGKYTCYEMVEDLRKIDKDIEVVPAHIWTPWFSLFGANSGFDSVEECFKDQAQYIHALETGLSSDPAMNWRVSALDKYALVSNSDLHSFWPWRLGREANIIEMKNITYKAFLDALRTKKNFVETIEVDPSFGKYHFTGHRNCNIVMAPSEAQKLKNICPVCKKKLTVGVLERVEELADRPEGFAPKDAIPFKSIIPLSEIINAVTGKAVSSKYSWQEYYRLVSRKEGRSEYDILLNLDKKELEKLSSPELAEAIMMNREGRVEISPGYDGVYGVPKIGIKKEAEEDDVSFPKKEKPKKEQPKPKKNNSQKGLNEFYK